MVCQICGKKSGYYPLCWEHYQMHKRGEVVQCANCETWHIKSEDCSVCEQTESDGIEKNQIRFQKSLIEEWMKRLYAIAKMGEKWASTDYDSERYESILRISGTIHDLWVNTKSPVIGITPQELESWSHELESIAKMGLRLCDDSHDIGRYSDILEVGEEIRLQIESQSLDLNDIPIAQSTSPSVRFIADQDILPALIEMIEKARTRILIASPWIWGKGGISDIVEKLTEAKEERNVSVKMLVRKPKSAKDEAHKETVRNMQRREFHVETEDYLHAKMILIDNKELYIGSANLVDSSLDRNLEVGICTSDPVTVSEALVYFDSAFSKAFDKRFEK
ncbi:MAG: NUDIX hydrolase N-terminal domain-containing protein [Candidatus Thorarchaeota archaeon]